MLRVLFALTLISGLSTQAHATYDGRGSSDEIAGSKVTDVTAEYSSNHRLAPANATVTTVPTNSSQAGSGPVANATPTTPATTNPTQTNQDPPVQVTLDQLITLGDKIWTFIVNNRPNAQYQTIQSSIVPAGVTNWTQLRGWKHPVSKVYRVQFQTIFGGDAGSFDYRISYVPGGSFDGKGKFLGQITFVPMNIKLHTDRTLNVKAEISDPINFGSETDPVAATQMIVSWTSPTTTRYQMNSAQYFIYGTGEIEDLTNGSR